MIYIELFCTFFIIGIFTFGGGYAMLSLIQSEVVVNHGWLTAEQFTDIVAVSQMTPGPIGINSATYVGYSVTNGMGYSHFASVCGSLVATLAVVLPSFIIVLTICRLFMKFRKSSLFASMMKTLRPVVIGMIAAAAGILVTGENFFHWSSWFLFCGAFVCCQWLKTNPIYVIIAGGVIGLLIY